MTQKDLIAAIQVIADKELEESEDDAWFGRPDRWYEDLTWRCVNDHVSKMYLKSEEQGDLCLACYEPIVLTFPEDKDGPLDTSI